MFDVFKRIFFKKNINILTIILYLLIASGKIECLILSYTPWIMIHVTQSFAIAYIFG